MKKYFLFFLTLGMLITSCSKDDDGIFEPTGPNPDPLAKADVQDFMWTAMNTWYFWQPEVPNLADNKFPNTPEGSKAYTDFLTSEDDPGSFFDKQLLYSEDRTELMRECSSDHGHLVLGARRSTSSSQLSTS